MAVGQWTRLLLAIATAGLLSQAVTTAADATGWRSAVDRLVREKALAEDCASILKSFADGNPMVRVQGQRQYARAKADVDGLIALLVTDLAGDRSPADIPELRHRLDAVPKQRRALCQHVDNAVGAAIRNEGGRNPADLPSRGTGDAESSLVEASVEIWYEYRRADPMRREVIVSEIETARWLPYAEVPED